MHAGQRCGAYAKPQQPCHPTQMKAVQQRSISLFNSTPQKGARSDAASATLFEACMPHALQLCELFNSQNWQSTTPSRTNTLRSSPTPHYSPSRVISMAATSRHSCKQPWHAPNNSARAPLNSIRCLNANSNSHCPQGAHCCTQPLTSLFTSSCPSLQALPPLPCPYCSRSSSSWQAAPWQKTPCGQPTQWQSHLHTAPHPQLPSQS